jgi:hypothetical protein
MDCMSRALLTATATIALLALTGASAASSQSVAPGPNLVIGSQSGSLVVRGRRFAHRERVRVTFRTGRQTLTRTVRATPTGTFSLTSPATLAYDPCSTTLVVAAAGTSGDSAQVRRPQRLCAPS